MGATSCDETSQSGHLTTDIGLVDRCGATRGIDLEVAAGDIDAAEAVRTLRPKRSISKLSPQECRRDISVSLRHSSGLATLSAPLTTFRFSPVDAFSASQGGP